MLAQVDSPVHSGDHSAPATVTWPRRIQKASSEAFQKEDTEVLSLSHPHIRPLLKCSEVGTGGGEGIIG